MLLSLPDLSILHFCPGFVVSTSFLLEMPVCLNKELKSHLHPLYPSFFCMSVYVTIAGIGEEKKDHGRAGGKMEEGRTVDKEETVKGIKHKTWRRKRLKLISS